jgi:hypothetical protein
MYTYLLICLLEKPSFALLFFLKKDLQYAACYYMITMINVTRHQYGGNI